MAGEAAFALRHQFVAQADIGEGAADHHLMVGAAADIGAEFLRRHAMLRQIGAGFGVGGNGAARRNMIGRHIVAQQQQNARAQDRRVRPLLAVQERRAAQEHAVADSRRRQAPVP